MQLNSMLKKLFLVVPFFLLAVFVSLQTSAQKLKINDSSYFEKVGVNVLVFSYEYNGMFFDEKTSAIGLIHHGVRTATGGAIRLQNTPEQWDLIPKMTSRKVDKKNNSIEVALRYEEFDFDSRVVVASKDKGIEISVYLDKPVPEKLVGKAGFNLEFLPSAYFEKTYLTDGKPGSFPLYPSGPTSIKPISEKVPQFAGHTTFDDRGRGEFIVPSPIATGKVLVLAPEDPERSVKIVSETAGENLMLFDGRNLAQNGWFIVRSLLPANKTGKVLTWYVEPNAVPNWKRKPNIAFSQAGYSPSQEKIAVIELDKNDTPLPTASLFQVTQDGKYVEKLKSDVKVWGRYFRYNYAKFDFSSVKQPGLYFIQYGGQKTNTFSIASNVYDNTWHPTLDVWFPVQMDHMEVNEAYRVWHGAPFLDDALQAPTNIQHFDGYSMGASTQTKYKPLERIPGMATGGWFDAGDFDIQTGSHCNVLLSLVDTWEKFKPTRDQTYIDYASHYVDIHRPDGKPDILQQIQHGTLNLVAQVKNIGHPVRGIVVPHLHQYHHLGDAINETDNLLYDSTLKPYQVKGNQSGTLDDRWAFTERTSFLDYYTAAALAASSRALDGFNDTLSHQSLFYAKQLWDENNIPSKKDTSTFARMFGSTLKINAALQLYIATKDKQYADVFKDAIWQSLKSLGGSRYGGGSIKTALQAIPYMDDDYKNKLREYVVKYKAVCDDYAKKNPYGVPIAEGGWGGSGNVVSFATANYYANKFYPDIINVEYVYKGLNYIFGCHPYSNISFVSSVGTKSKKVTYGNNRANFSFIAGGIVPGILLIQPDFLENKEDWPFFWGENEVTVGGCADYIFLANAAAALVSDK